MSTESVAARGGGWGLRLLVLVPIVLLVAIAAAFVASGGSITGLVGNSPAVGGHARRAPGGVPPG